MTPRTKTCGCSAGILINRESYAIERCDECSLFATDEDAVGAIDVLLTLLGDVYEVAALGTTVACAMDAITTAVRPRTYVSACRVPTDWRHVASGDGIACYGVGPRWFVAAIGTADAYDAMRVTAVRPSMEAAIADAYASRWFVAGAGTSPPSRKRKPRKGSRT